MGSMPTPSYGPEVQRVSVDTPVEDVIYLLKRDGGVFIQGFVSPEQAEQAYDECRARIDGDLAWDGKFFPSAFHSHFPVPTPSGSNLCMKIFNQW